MTACVYKSAKLRHRYRVTRNVIRRQRYLVLR